MESPNASSPAAFHFFVRRYLAAPSPALHAALQTALHPAMMAFETERDVATRARWLGAFADASVMAVDGTLQAMVNEQLPQMVDELERLMRHVYEPGEGAAGAPADRQLVFGLALVTAFDLTARLPYAMLSEELLQTLLRTSWNEAARTDDAAATCRAAQLCYRLAALHRDPDYLARATIAPNARYAEVGATLLQAVHAHVTRTPQVAAEYGLAMLDAARAQ